MRLVQRPHAKDGCPTCLGQTEVPEGAVYLGLIGDADYPVHMWDLDFKPWLPPTKPVVVVNEEMAPRLSDERLAEILRDLPKPSPAPMDPGVYRRNTEEPEQAFPTPLVTSDDGQEPDVRPKPVTDLEAYAVARGWRVTVTYAEGWVPHARLGTPSAKPKTSWALRMSRRGRRAVAVRMDSAWDSFWILSPDGMVPHTTLASFQEALD